MKRECSKAVEDLLQMETDLRALKRIQSSLPQLPCGVMRDHLSAAVTELISTSNSEQELERSSAASYLNEIQGLKQQLNESSQALKEYEAIIDEDRLGIFREQQGNQTYSGKVLFAAIGLTFVVTTLLSLILR